MRWWFFACRIWILETPKLESKSSYLWALSYKFFSPPSGSYRIKTIAAIQIKCATLSRAYIKSRPLDLPSLFLLFFFLWNTYALYHDVGNSNKLGSSFFVHRSTSPVESRAFQSLYFIVTISYLFSVRFQSQLT